MTTKQKTTTPSLRASKAQAHMPSRGVTLNALHGTKPMTDAERDAKRAARYPSTLNADVQRIKDSLKPKPASKGAAKKAAKKSARTGKQADPLAGSPRRQKSLGTDAMRASIEATVKPPAAQTIREQHMAQMPWKDGDVKFRAACLDRFGVADPQACKHLPAFAEFEREFREKGTVAADDTSRTWKRDLSKTGDDKRGDAIVIPAGLREAEGIVKVTPQVEAIAGTSPLGANVIDMASARDSDVGFGDKLEEEERAGETAEQLQQRLEQRDTDKPAEALAAPSSMVLSVKQLRAALMCAATTDIRSYLNTVRVHRAQGQVRLVSTDGHRLLCQSSSIDAAGVPEWIDAGVLLSSSDLGAAIAVCAKHGDTVSVEWAPGHPHAIVKSADQFATFRVWVADGTFPDYQRIMNDVDLSNAGGDALATAALNPQYVKDAAQVAKALDAKSMQSFAGNGERAAAFLFAGADAVMVIMPMRIDAAAGLLTERTVAIVGGGLASSVGALRAHLTRTSEKLAATTDAGEKKKLAEKVSEYRERIDAVLRMASAALPAPTKKAA